MKPDIVVSEHKSTHFQFWLKSDSNNGHYMTTCLIFGARLEHNSVNTRRKGKQYPKRNSRKTRNTLYVQYTFSVSLLVFEINTRERTRQKYYAMCTGPDYLI
jgi:hypothetical protein